VTEEDDQQDSIFEAIM